MAIRKLITLKTAGLLLLAVFGVISAYAQHSVPGIDILQQPRCDVGAALVPNMQDCVIDELMGSNGTLAFSFNVEAKAKHSVLLTLRSVGGAAVMRLYNSKNDVVTGQVVYYNDAVTESFVRVSATDIVGGQYTLVVQGMGGATQKILLYLRVQTPPANSRLAKEDKAAMLSILKECCPSANNPMAPEVCTSFLPAALNAKKPEDDLCNIGDFVCDDDGHLQKIDFSNAGLMCKRFPAAFGKFPALETLMLRYNDFGEDTLDSVAEVLSGTTTLRRLMLGATNLTGTVPCSLVEDHELRTLMISINKLEGSLPECVLASNTLEELYMSRVTLTGRIPDSIPTDSNLRVWYAINRDPVTGEQPGPGFTGEIPPSISNAAGLAFVELSNHQLTGGVPALPAGMRMFEAQSNQLDGGIASPLPQNLVYLDVMNNSLVGPVPDFSEAKELTLLDLSDNELTGNLPETFGAAGDSLVYMDMSKNNLEGPVNPGTLWERVPQLQYAFLQDNNLEGPAPASLAASTRLVALNLADNNLSGDLKAFAGAINPPRATSPQKGGRRLSEQTQGHHCHHRASQMVAKKLFGSYEEYTAPNPSGWQLEPRNIAALATHNFADARRRLQQVQAPAAGIVATTPATTAATITPVAAQVPPAATVPAAKPVTKPAAAPIVPAAAEPEVPPTLAEEELPAQLPAAAATPAEAAPEAEVPAAGGATTTMVGPDAAAPAAEPVAEPAAEPVPHLPQEQEPSAPAPEAPDSAMQMPPDTPAAAAAAQQNDIGVVEIPSNSALAGNSFLYLNMSNNLLTGPVPEELGNLEMFRSPANSTDPYDMYVFSRGGPDRSLDLTNNELYGEFPLFLIDQPTDLSDHCLCLTTFNVSDGNFLFCPTKGTLGAMQTTKAEMQLLTQANYTCMLPGKKERVSLAQYLSKPANWISEIPPASEVVVERAPKTTSRSSGIYPTNAPSGSTGSSSGVGPGAIAGIVIGVLAALAILGSLAYFVGYKKFWTEHRATSFKRGQIPDGPAMDGAAAYPAAAYGADIETPAPAPR